MEKIQLTNLKHSPGPWQVSWNTFNQGEAHGIYTPEDFDLKGFQIAVVNYYPTIKDDADEETGKANARLIAEAPALLEALDYLMAETHSESYGYKLGMAILQRLGVKK